jgi:hypothetical protein
MIPHLLITLASAAPTADPQISGNWITAFVIAVITAAGGIWLSYKRGQANPSHETTIKSPVPTVTVRNEPRWATHDELAAVANDMADLREDVDKKLDKLLAGQAEERRVAREALGKVHSRSDANAVALAELKGEMGQINANVQRLLTLATNTKPPRG